MQSIVHQSWYALTVRPQHEKAVAKALAYKRLEPFLPVYKTKRRWSDRVKLVELPLFSNYVFCRFVPSERLGVVTTPGVRTIVSLGRLPIPVPETDMEAIRTAVSSGRPVQPWPLLREGQSVLIRKGPLKGLRGRLTVASDAWRIVVNVDLLQRSVAVLLDRDEIEATREPGETSFV